MSTTVQVDRDEVHDEVAEARGAVLVGLWASATRCVLLYVVAPALGLLGVALGAAGVALQVLGAITSASGAIRLRRAGHRWWPAYAVVSLVVTLTAVAALAEALR